MLEQLSVERIKEIIFKNPTAPKAGPTPPAGVPSIPSGQSKSWKSTKAIYPIGLGGKVILQLFL